MARSTLNCSLLVLLPLGLLFAAHWYLTEKWPWGHEFNSRTPQQVFLEVSGRPVPNGVSELRAVGRQYSNKRWARLSFKASDAVISQLTDECAVPGRAGMRDALAGRGWVADRKFENEDLAAVGWGELRKAVKPEICTLRQVDSRSARWMWLGYVVVDRKRHKVYVHAGSD